MQRSENSGGVEDIPAAVTATVVLEVAFTQNRIFFIVKISPYPALTSELYSITPIA